MGNYPEGAVDVKGNKMARGTNDILMFLSHGGKMQLGIGSEDIHIPDLCNNSDPNQRIAAFPNKNLFMIEACRQVRDNAVLLQQATQAGQVTFTGSTEQQEHWWDSRQISDTIVNGTPVQTWQISVNLWATDHPYDIVVGGQ
jgi:hypothetical protein